MAAPPYSRALATEALVDGQQGIMSQFRQNETSVEFFSGKLEKSSKFNFVFFEIFFDPYFSDFVDFSIYVSLLN